MAEKRTFGEQGVGDEKLDGILRELDRHVWEALKDALRKNPYLASREYKLEDCADELRLIGKDQKVVEADLMAVHNIAKQLGLREQYHIALSSRDVRERLNDEEIKRLKSHIDGARTVTMGIEPRYLKFVIKRKIEL